MLVELTQSHFGSLSQNVPEVKLQNLYLVKNPLSITETSYVTRPVISAFASVSEEAIRGIYYQQGFADDKVFVVTGTSVYTLEDSGVITNIGTILGEGFCKFASTIYGICIVSGDYTYIYDGTTFNLVAIPDSLIVEDVTSLNNYFILAIKDDNKFYWVLPGEITIDPLSFASAEANPDDIVSIQVISDELWIIGKTTTEVWAPTADPDAPFQRISGRVFNQGCSSVSSVSSALFKGYPCLLWVSAAKEVVLAQGVPQKISNDFIEEVLKSSAYYYGWYFRRHRNDFYLITTDLMTLVYDLSNDVWYRWVSDGRDNLKVSYGIQKNNTLYGIDLLTSGDVYKLVDGTRDESIDWLVCEVAGFVKHNSSKPLPCSSVEIIANGGFSSAYGTEPIVEVRWSDDQGANWSSYVQTSLGDRGETSKSITFRSLGLIKTPGRRFEFRFSGSESFRLDYVILNNEV